MKEDNSENKELQNIRDRFKMNPPENAWNSLDADLERKQAASYRQRGNRFKLLSIGLALLLFSSVTYYYISPGHQSVSDNSVAKSNDQAIINGGGEVSQKPSAGVHSEVGVSSGNDDPASKRGLGTRDNVSLPVVPRSSSLSFKKAGLKRASPINSAPSDGALTTAARAENDDSPSASPKPNTVENDKPEDASKQPSSSYGSDLTKNASGEGDDMPPDPDNGAACESAPAVASSANTIVSGTDTAATSKPTPNGNHSSRWSVDAFYAPDYYSRNYLIANNPGYNESIADYGNREKSEYSYAAGLNLRYDLTRHWSIAVGGTYSTIAYSITLPTVYAKYDSDGQLHYIYPTSCGNIEMPNPTGAPLYYGDTLNTKGSCSQVVKIISVPVTVRYKIEAGRLTFYADAGLSVHFVMQEKANMNVWNTDYTIVNNVDGLNKMNYGYLFGTGAEYVLSHGLAVFVEPAFRGSFTSLTQNTGFYCYPYAFGLNTGVSLHF